MTNLEALVTNIELCSKTDGYSTVTFPTLKKLSVSGKAFGSSLTSITADKMNGTNHCGKWGSSLWGRPLGTPSAPQSPVHTAPCVHTSPCRGGSPVDGFPSAAGHTQGSGSEGKRVLLEEGRGQSKIWPVSQMDLLCEAC